MGFNSWIPAVRTLGFPPWSTVRWRIHRWNYSGTSASMANSHKLWEWIEAQWRGLPHSRMANSYYHLHSILFLFHPWPPPCLLPSRTVSWEAPVLLFLFFWRAIFMFFKYPFPWPSCLKFFLLFRCCWVSSGDGWGGICSGSWSCARCDFCLISWRYQTIFCPCCRPPKRWFYLKKFANSHWIREELLFLLWI